jgi:hypothetical protein
MAGGACIFNDPTYGNVFAGMQQASVDTVSVYELDAGGPIPASVDIKANGEDSAVVINDGDNAVLDIRVTAGDDAGLNCDIWVIVRNGAGKKWSFNLNADRWFKGWCYEYISAPLTDYVDNVLDMDLPVGTYEAWIGIDTNMNGNLNKDAILVYDYVDFEVVAYVPPLWDNGWQDDVVAIQLNHTLFAPNYMKGYDDFVVPATETWTLTGFTNYGVYPYAAAGASVGWELDIMDDAAGPGTIIHTATSVALTETDTGMLLFAAYPIWASEISFDPIVLTEGTYWIRESADCPVEYYYGCTRTATAGIQGSEAWYEDTGCYSVFYGPVSTNPSWTYGAFDFSFLILGTK